MKVKKYSILHLLELKMQLSKYCFSVNFYLEFIYFIIIKKTTINYYIKNKNMIILQKYNYKIETIFKFKKIC